MLKHVPNKESKEQLRRLSYRVFELESSRYRDYLPLKEYSW
jgi:hypothetical protein